MPTANFSRINLDLLYPPFLEKALQLIANCEARGARYVATYGYRTYVEQMQLWAKGRTQGTKVVTNAMPGESSHNFGLAIDFVRDTDLEKQGVQPGWAPADYQVLIEEAGKLGLHSGASYKDFPHVAWPNYITKADMAPLDKRWKSQDCQKLPTLVDKLKELWKAVILPQ